MSQGVGYKPMQPKRQSVNMNMGGHEFAAYKENTYAGDPSKAHVPTNSGPAGHMTQSMPSVAKAVK